MDYYVAMDQIVERPRDEIDETTQWSPFSLDFDRVITDIDDDIVTARGRPDVQFVLGNTPNCARNASAVGLSTRYDTALPIQFGLRTNE